MKKQIDDKNNQIAKLRTDEAFTKEQFYNLSAESSSQITMLKNEIASVEKTAKLYFQMYYERKINQVLKLFLLSIFLHLIKFRIAKMKKLDFLDFLDENK